ncbi:hypothetical protein D477_007049 [Arthrobacter crystallopoietes BAB-32]|uniref:Uncharacterized protein n=1 Tax=Arthrobacter crystallopoietes BAB-32 TaxID=1246476 RepID=N1V4K3_9MICC|nr:hypothetical protein [Arthrobacter crystallopoietes]EMY34944.1 hypothetical protein D477_007049 [Arthrobacter crystallopoietes BAB-32]
MLDVLPARTPAETGFKKIAGSTVNSEVWQGSGHEEVPREGRKNMFRDQELKSWVVIGSLLALIAVGCGLVFWFTVLVPGIEWLHSH